MPLFSGGAIIISMGALRDPVSEQLDDGARVLLQRLYAARGGQWVSTLLADPGPRLRAWADGLGIDLSGPDNAPTRSGRRQDAHTRYGRAFVRSLYHNHKWYGAPGGVRATVRAQAWSRPLEIEWGRRRPAVGIIPAGRALRVRLRPGGKTAQQAVRRRGEGDRIYTDDGAPGGRHAEAEGRDWYGRDWQ